MFNFDCIACLAAENTLEKTSRYRLFLFMAFFRGRIEIETEPDWIQIQIRFCFLYRSDASASYQGLYGGPESKWEKTESGYVFTVTVPSNCEAEVDFTDGSRHLQAIGTVTDTGDGFRGS